MSIQQTVFGVDLIGRNNILYTMTNKQGASVSVLDFGAHLVSVKVPDKNGVLAEVCLGYDTLEGYDQDKNYCGPTLGRYANRIANSCFELNGKEYHLYPTHSDHTLHGGREHFGLKWWQGQTLEAEGEDTVLLTYVSHDGEEGFPGTMRVQVSFSWNDENVLTIRYLATCDQDTIVNLTNHAYWNLAGAGVGDIKDHVVQVNSDKILSATDTLLPDGNFIPVDGTVLDLRAPRSLRDGLDHIDSCKALQQGGGYDCTYVINGEGMREAAKIKDPSSGRTLRVVTDEPSMQLYTGQGWNATGRGGQHYGPFAGVAVETQHFPDSIHFPQFPNVILKAGETFHSNTQMIFAAE